MYHRLRPRLERLEDRTTPANLFVSNSWELTADNGTSGVLDAGDIITDGTNSYTIGTDLVFGVVTSGSVTGNLPAGATIQSAINAAASGDTVNVLAGSYTETLTIGVGITLKGVGISTDITGGILVNANNVTIRDLEILEGATILGELAGVYVNNNVDGLTINNVTFTRSGTVDADGSRGVLTSSAGVSNLTVQNSTFTGWATGVYINPNNTNVTISGNTFDNNFVHASVDGGSPSFTGNTFKLDTNSFEGIGIGGGTPSISSNTFIRESGNASFVSSYTTFDVGPVFSANTFQDSSNNSVATVQARIGSQTVGLFGSIDAALAFSTNISSLILSAGTFSGATINHPTALTITGDGAGSTIIDGASPALTVSSTVTVTGATLTTSTADPTILITGTGNLTLRNSTVEESTGSDQTALSIQSGGQADLGTTGDPGNNTLNINGAGSLIVNNSANAISAIGNTWQQDASTITNNFTIEDEITHALDTAGLGLVRWVANNVYVTPNSGSIQRGVNAASSGDTVNVSDGTYIENVTINNKNLTLQSVNGRTVTKIVGTTGLSLGTIQLSGTTTGVQIGTTGKGFHIVGFDGPSAGIEVGAVYIGGNHSNLSIVDNEIEANGDHGLIAEFAAVLNNVTVSNNIFSGQTFVGPNPAGVDFSAQFTLNNVPRQLVVFGNGGGSGPSNVTNLTFTNNQITGTTGGISLTDNSGNPNAPTPQGNTLVTLDVSSSTISGNTFAGTTTASASALRVRRPNTTISGNTFNSSNMTDTTNNLFVQNNTTPLQTIVAANTYDRGAYHVGGTTVWQTIQAAVAAAAVTGTTVAVLPTAGGYAENVVVQRVANNLQSISLQFDSSSVSVNPSSGDAFTIPNGVTAFFNSTFVTTAPTVVQTGGTMGGNGGVTGPVTINTGGTMSPGLSPGIINTGNYSQSGKLDIEIVQPLTTTVAGTDYDQVNVTGTVTLNSGSQLNLIFTGSGTIPVGKSIILINNDGTDAVTGSFSTVTVNNGPALSLTPVPGGVGFTAGGVNWILVYDGGDGNDVVLTSVTSFVTPTTIYIDDDWGAFVNGDPIADADLGTAGSQSATFGFDAFTSIAAAQTIYPSFAGLFIVNGGTYGATTLANGQDMEITGPDAAQTVIFASLTTAVGENIVIEGNSTLTVDAGTIAGVISGTGNLVKQGSGTLTLSGANTYTGTTTVNAGTLTLAGGAAIVNTGAVIVNGGTLNLAASETIGSLAGAAGTSVTLNNFTLTTGDSSNTIYAGVISGTGNLVKQGTGTFTLSGANTYSGQSTINAGELKLTGSLTGAGLGVVLNGVNVIFSGGDTGVLQGNGRSVTANALATNATIRDFATIHNTTAGTTGVDILNGATVRLLNNKISGNHVNVSVDGPAARALLEGNTLNNATLAGLRISGNAQVDAGQKAGGFDFTGLGGGGVGPTNGGSKGNNVFNGYTAYTGSSLPNVPQAILNLNNTGANANAGPQGAPTDVYAQYNTFNGTTAASLMGGSLALIENLVWHDFDNSGRGFVNYVAPAALTATTVGGVRLLAGTDDVTQTNNYTQASMVRLARVSFDNYVSIDMSGPPANRALVITRVGTTFNDTAIDTTTNLVVNAQTGAIRFNPFATDGRYFNYDLTFSGPGVELSGSLQDGEYTLSFDGSKVQSFVNLNDMNIPALQGGSGISTLSFHRLFGDYNGDKKVDSTDLAAFNAAMRSRRNTANFREYFNFDWNSVIDTQDQTAFNRRLNRYLS